MQIYSKNKVSKKKTVLTLTLVAFSDNHKRHKANRELIGINHIKTTNTRQPFLHEKNKLLFEFLRRTSKIKYHKTQVSK